MVYFPRGRTFFAQTAAVALSLMTLILADATAADKLEKKSSPTAETPPARDISLTVRLVRSRAVQDELKIATQQRQKIDALVSEVEYPLFLLRDVPEAERRERLDTLSGAAQDQLRSLLEPAQRGRLSELLLQAEGYAGLLHPVRAEALGLSAEQRDKVRALLVETNSDQTAPKARASIEKKILATLNSEQQAALTDLTGRSFDLSKIPQVACRAPELRDVEAWINSPPLSLAGQRGRVVAVHFWAFGCINCVRNLPWYQGWQERYAEKGLTIVGIQTPETPRERERANLEKEIAERKIAYPVAIDNQQSNWNAWANRLWPSVYLVDKRGYVRYWWYGELNWQGAKGEEIMRRRIEELLAER